MRSTSEFAHAVVDHQAAAGNRCSVRSVLNDVHARLNPAVPALQRRPDSLVALRSSVEQARRRGLGISIAGGRHAMGGQQFLQGGMALDMRGMNRILDFDQDAGLITVEAGASCSALISTNAGRPIP